MEREMKRSSLNRNQAFVGQVFQKAGNSVQRVAGTAP